MIAWNRYYVTLGRVHKLLYFDKLDIRTFEEHCLRVLIKRNDATGVCVGCETKECEMVYNGIDCKRDNYPNKDRIHTYKTICISRGKQELSRMYGSLQKHYKL